MLLFHVFTNAAEEMTVKYIQVISHLCVHMCLSTCVRVRACACVHMRACVRVCVCFVAFVSEFA